ncbi:hypothetical protein ElyMa_005920300 [Elysia marginata]|uniref:Uncharacterized protein n=1 Tax=Elysia marginata TaxID=1093978 RepID=A0AAV4G754_9GAST|nr:hypothetical protein ElyMa_005920300 [Elysia marginata]
MVDCDLMKSYGVSLTGSPNVYTIKDMKLGRMYVFAPGFCTWSEITPEFMGEQCRVPEDAQYTGEVFLAGRTRQGWSRIQGPFRYEQLEVVTRVTEDRDGAPGCLPFLSRMRTKGKSVISSSFFYEVRGGISDPSVFQYDTTNCIGIDSKG